MKSQKKVTQTRCNNHEFESNFELPLMSFFLGDHWVWCKS